ncbi:MAG: HDOD domain-containing protein, partial [Planctomycetes bacterium]|nr:HDOD domain-containing protein [Planctomycetota bacterium]
MIKKRILFVDDEPNVVDGLRRLLRKQRQVWHMEFAQSGAEALAKLAEMPFDVLVTDIQMPGMNGAELLERVVQAYPGVARIVLSGHVDETVATRVVSLAHRFLAKPTDADTLIAAVERAGVAQQEIGDERVRAWIGSCRSLPSLPTLYVELMQAAHSDTTNAREIARIISRDMAISAKILQLVNSSFFGLARRISSIEQTVSLLGLVRIRALVLAEHVVRKLMPENAPSGLTINHLWSHSCAVAEVAHRISKLE